MLTSSHDAIQLLVSLGAPERLIKHHELVAEAGDLIIKQLEMLKVPFDSNFVRLGIAVHDAGKIVHPNELDAKGNMHEQAGEHLLLSRGVQKEIARCCLSHAQYGVMHVCFEEKLIALADKLWKGKRVSDLELQVIDDTAALLGQDRWDIFPVLDSCFEQIAQEGDTRLARSL
ncbi:hypothetical protein [Pseudaestuariivita rosea]|uniref:hypothetical protein n=1 Tax=Pseudaestuariivita rosea TaxID=2763263 RepID=UPI001ABA8C30|nr:hypothetical protein [Pseudaestuariivita rosea]